MIDAERARRTALTSDVWETVRTAREAPEPARSRPWPYRRWLLVTAAVAVVGAGALAAHDLFSTPTTHTTSRTKPQAGAHLSARAARIATHAAAVTSSKRVTKTAVADHAALKARKAVARRHPAAHPKATVHTRAPVARPRATVHTGARAARPKATVHAHAPVAHPKATVHTHARVAGTHASPKPTRKSHSRPQTHRGVPSTPIHPAPKTFVWLKVAGAAGYRVALFKRSVAILFRDTKTPRLTVPGSWRYEGKPRTLSPGRYRWYVWSLDGRRRPSARAIVSSTLVIGR